MRARTCLVEVRLADAAIRFSSPKEGSDLRLAGDNLLTQRMYEKAFLLVYEWGQIGASQSDEAKLGEKPTFSSCRTRRGPVSGAKRSLSVSL